MEIKLLHLLSIEQVTLEKNTKEFVRRTVTEILGERPPRVETTKRRKLKYYGHQNNKVLTEGRGEGSRGREDEEGNGKTI